MALQQPDFAKMPCLAVDFNDKETMAKLQAFSNSQQISGPSRSLILLDADGKAPLWSPLDLKDLLENIEKMKVKSSSKETMPLEKRKVESRGDRCVFRLPHLLSDNMVPIIVTKALLSNLPEIQINNFMVPGNMKCDEFKHILHIVGLNPELLCLSIDGSDGMATFLEPQSMLSEVYDCQKAYDGFLYITYLSEDDLMWSWNQLARSLAVHPNTSTCTHA